MTKDSVFCYFCIKQQEKLLAENNKDPAYISTGFRNWKKAPKCFKEHEQIVGEPEGGYHDFFGGKF